MKILLISYYFLQADSTGSLRARAMAKYLPKNGIEVSVLASKAQQEPLTFCDDIIGVKDRTRDTVPLWFFYLMRIWQKGLRLFGLYRGYCAHWRDLALEHADEIIEHVKPDAILASYPCIEALEIGVALSEKYGLPLISDFRDGLVFEPLDMDAVRRNAVRRYYQDIEARVVAASQLIVTVSKPIADYFEKAYLHRNVMTLPNGFDVDDIHVESDVTLPSEVIHIAHTGRLELSRKETSGKGIGVDALGQALQLLSDRVPELSRKLHIHFIGELSASEKSCLLPFTQSGVAKLWGHLPRAKAIAFQHKADVLLLITAPDRPSIATGKIFEYLAANKPILTLTRGTAAETIIVETGAGIVVPPDNPEAIANALQSILEGNGTIMVNRNEGKIMTFSRDHQIHMLASRMKAF